MEKNKTGATHCTYAKLSRQKSHFPLYSGKTKMSTICKQLWCSLFFINILTSSCRCREGYSSLIVSAAGKEIHKHKHTHTHTHARLCARPRSIHSRSPQSHMLCKLRWYLLKEKQTLVLVFVRLNSQLGEYLPASKYLHWGVSDSFMDLYFFLMATLTGEGSSGARGRRTPNGQTKKTCYECALKVHRTGKVYV